MIEGDLTPQESPDPLSVECPLCAAPVGKPCQIFTSLRPHRLAKAPHGSRVKKAKREAQHG